MCTFVTMRNTHYKLHLTIYKCNNVHRKGSSIYDIHKKIRFLTPSSPCPHEPEPPLWTSTCGRHEIHIAF